MSNPLLVITFDGGASTKFDGEQCASVVELFDDSGQHRRKLLAQHCPGHNNSHGQYGELMGILYTFQKLAPTIDHCVENFVPIDLLIRGDSEYVVYGCTKRMNNWIRRDYKDLQNVPEWKAIHAVIRLFQRIGFQKIDGKGTDPIHDFCHDVIQDLRFKGGHVEMMTFSIDDAPAFERNPDTEIWQSL
jgi:ribonuclease HI